jgi:DNA-binding transcriptional LysR family regulator
VTRSAVAAVAEIELAASRSPRYRRRFIVGLMDHAVGELTWPQLRTLHDARPDLSLNVVHVGFADALPWLHSAVIDVLLAIGPFGEEDGAVTTVGGMPVGAILPARHPQAEATTIETSWVASRVAVTPPAGMGRTFADFWTLQDAGGPPVGRLRVPEPDLSGVRQLLEVIERGAVGLWPAGIPVTPAHALLPLETSRVAPLQIVAAHRAQSDVLEFCRTALLLSRG